MLWLNVTTDLGGHVFRPLVIAAVAFASFVPALAPAHAARAPHITDPAGDVSGSVCPVPGVFFTCLGAAQPYAQPAVDVVSVDFSSARQALVADVGVLDLGAPIAGDGTEGYDGTRYVVAFSTDPSHSPTVNLIAEYDTAGTATRAELVVFLSFSQPQHAKRPIELTADVSGNRIRFEVPLAVLNEAIAAACPECSPVARGSELHAPFGNSAVFDNGTFGQSVVAGDTTPFGNPPYTVGK